MLLLGRYAAGIGSFPQALTYRRLHNQFLVIAQYCRKEEKKARNRSKVHY